MTFPKQSGSTHEESGKSEGQENDAAPEETPMPAITEESQAPESPRTRTGWRYKRETQPTVTTTIRLPLSRRNWFMDYLDQHEVTISTALDRSLRLLEAQNDSGLTIDEATRLLRAGDPRARASGRKARPS